MSDKEYTRRVVIDDTNTRIQYSPNPDAWSLDVGSFDDRGNYGQPYKRTMHRTNKSGASLSFIFEGDYVLVRGAQDIRNNGTPPTWTCSLDGSPIPVFPFRDANRITHNNLCELSRMSRRSHTLTVNVTVEDPANQMFWLDYLEYAPLEEVNLDGNTMKIDSSDTRVTYNNASAQWKELSSQMNGTGVAGGSLSFKFNGTSVSLFTFLEGSNEDWSSSPARYHIDNAADTSITIPGTKHLSGSGNRSDFYNQLLFTSPDLSPGEHELSLSFDGVAQSGKPPIQWLIVDYFHVNVSGTHTPSNGGGPPTSVIVGAVVGGLVGLIGAGLAVYFFMKRRKETRQRQGTGTPGSFVLGYNNNHNYAAVTPFIPEEDSHRSTTAYNPLPPSGWESSVRPSTSTGTMTTYPPEKNYHLSNASTSSSYPLVSPGSRSSLSSGRNSHARPLTTLSPPAPPNTSSDNSSSDFNPYSDLAPDSSAGTRSMKGTQSTGTSSVIHVRHEDSGIRLPSGNDLHMQDLPPGYTRD